MFVLLPYHTRFCNSKSSLRMLHNGTMIGASSFNRYNVEKRVLFNADGKCLDAPHSCGHIWRLAYLPLLSDLHCQV